MVRKKTGMRVMTKIKLGAADLLKRVGGWSGRCTAGEPDHLPVSDHLRAAWRG